MKIRIKNIIYILAAAIMINGCHPEIDVPQESAGTADFSKYVSVGNSLTAGISDSGLYAEAQIQSFPYQLAQQMNEISTINFIQPDAPGDGSGYFYVSDLDITTSPPTPSLSIFFPDSDWLKQLDGPFNNLGVNGLRVKDITVKGYGASSQGNAHYYRMLGGKDPNMSYLEMVQESEPTFFTSWLGNNDVLEYALAGGANGTRALTDPETEFKPSYDALITALTSKGAKGVVATIPDITLIPYFTTIPWNGLALDATLAAAATQFYAFGIDTTVQTLVEVEVIMGAATEQVYQGAYDQAIGGGATEEQAIAAANAFVASPEGQAAISVANDLIAASYYGLPESERPNHPLYPTIIETKNGIIALMDNAGLIPKFSEGPNAFVIEVPTSPTNPLGIRQMKEGEFVLLTALLAGEINGTNALFPKSDRYILTSDEVKNIVDYTADFNDIIRGYTSSQDIALFESNDLLEQVKDGMWVDGVNVDAGYLTGGVFSLDGVHMTPRGYSIVANGFIETINDSFNSSLSPVNINSHRAVVLP